MNLKESFNEVGNVQNAKQARETHTRIRHELARDGHTDADRKVGEQALRALETAYPDAAAPKPASPATTPKAPRPATPRPAAAPVARPRSTRSTSVTRQARQAVGFVDTATGGWGQVISAALIGGFGLSLGYLVLAGRGPIGLGRLFVGGTSALNWIISPNIDPLRPPKGAKP